MWPNIRVHENHTSQPNIASSTEKVKLLYCICITSKRKCVVTQDGAGHIDTEIKNWSETVFIWLFNELWLVFFFFLNYMIRSKTRKKYYKSLLSAAEVGKHLMTELFIHHCNLHLQFSVFHLPLLSFKLWHQ